MADAEYNHPIEALRAAVAELPDEAKVVCLDGTGGLYELGEVAGVSTDEGPLLVLTLRKVGQDPAVDGWTGIDDLPGLVSKDEDGEQRNPMDAYVAFGEMDNPVPGPEEPKA